MSDDANAILAGAIMAIEDHVNALDILMRGLYENRARELGLSPDQFAAYMTKLTASIDRSPRRGFEGESRALEQVKQRLETFSEAVQVRLRD